jgi:hypothetical protein
MLARQLWEKYPQMFHMTEPGSWPSIQKYGLLSTSSLLDLFEVPRKDRIAIETCRRSDPVPLTHPVHGSAVIRDQKPLSEKRLATCLTGGITVKQWLRLLNGRVFFWLEEARLDTLRGAQAYRSQRQVVLTVDTRRFVEGYATAILLTHMNTGATRPFAHKRGRNTFCTIPNYPFQQHRKAVELTVAREVRDISMYVLKVEELGGNQAPATLWCSK